MRIKVITTLTILKFCFFFLIWAFHLIPTRLVYSVIFTLFTTQNFETLNYHVFLSESHFSSLMKMKTSFSRSPRQMIVGVCFDFSALLSHLSIYSPGFIDFSYELSKILFCPPGSFIYHTNPAHNHFIYDLSLSSFQSMSKQILEYQLQLSYLSIATVTPQNATPTLT